MGFQGSNELLGAGENKVDRNVQSLASEKVD